MEYAASAHGSRVGINIFPKAICDRATVCMSRMLVTNRRANIDVSWFIVSIEFMQSSSSDPPDRFHSYEVIFVSIGCRLSVRKCRLRLYNITTICTHFYYAYFLQLYRRPRAQPPLLQPPLRLQLPLRPGPPLRFLLLLRCRLLATGFTNS